MSSRLLEYEMWNRRHARRLATSHGEDTRELLERLALLELAPPVLARALEAFPSRVRTLDALHLASIEFLRAQRHDVALASYDSRMLSRGARPRHSGARPVGLSPSPHFLPTVASGDASAPRP